MDQAHDLTRDPTRGAKLDFLASIVLMLLGFGIVAEASGIPRFETAGSSSYNYTWPGLVPSFHGVVLLLLSFLLMLRAARAGGARLRTGERLWQAPAEALPARLMLAAGLCLAFVLVLVGRMPFWLASFVFLAVAFIVFSWQRWGEDGRRVRAVTHALLLAAFVAGLVFYVFQELFLVRLP